MNETLPCRIGVVIPCYRVKAHILDVLAGIPEYVTRVYVVDDACPENSGQYVQDHYSDPRLLVIFHEENQGVGGAVISGYRAGIRDGMDIMVKIDGDGQMDPQLLPQFTHPILQGWADYTKGNRFYRLEDVRAMPAVRILGNMGLSFLTKLSSGYWNIFDPTNGYTAIHCKVLELLPLTKLNRRYFFESDMLFRLNTVHAVVVDIPMRAVYGNEKSNLRISRLIMTFLCNHARNFFKRIFYNYFLRNFSLASIQLVLGTGLLAFGVFFGIAGWLNSAMQGETASAGTVMLAALPIIIGTQMLLSFINYDVNTVPDIPLWKKLLP